ncbi:uncharacterized protein LOC122861151 [Aphidius gifuensis]|uniref:uncharacterized protein LOC122861151 n=1 Tax=Aphidius gifuensis TaxID=684658 RepID=UPI001CDBB8AE|nr:uncharacterized protein LOC122861151 [Aphidius gifuensis]
MKSSFSDNIKKICGDLKNSLKLKKRNSVLLPKKTNSISAKLQKQLLRPLKKKNCPLSLSPMKNNQEQKNSCVGTLFKPIKCSPKINKNCINSNNDDDFGVDCASDSTSYSSLLSSPPSSSGSFDSGINRKFESNNSLKNDINLPQDNLPQKLPIERQFETTRCNLNDKFKSDNSLDNSRHKFCYYDLKSKQQSLPISRVLDDYDIAHLLGQTEYLLYLEKSKKNNDKWRNTW